VKILLHPSQRYSGAQKLTLLTDVTKTGNGERGTGNGERGAGSREPGAGSREPGAGNGEPGNRGTGEPGNRGTGEPGNRGTGEPGNREPGTGVWEQVKEFNMHSKGKVCIRAKWPIRPELILVSVA